MARRRANGEGSIRKRKDGSWEARITLGYDPFGKQVTKSVYGRTQRDVKEKMERLKADLEGGSKIVFLRLLIRIRKLRPQERRRRIPARASACLRWHSGWRSGKSSISPT